MDVGFVATVLRSLGQGEDILWLSQNGDCLLSWQMRRRCSPSYSVIEWRSVRSVYHVERTGQKRNAYRFGNLRTRKVVKHAMCCRNVTWRCELESDKCRAVVNTVVNCLVSTNWRMLRFPKQNSAEEGHWVATVATLKHRLCVASKYSVSCLVCWAEYRQPEAWLVAVWACHLTPHHTTPQHNTPHHTTANHTITQHTTT